MNKYHHRASGSIAPGAPKKRRRTSPGPVFLLYSERLKPDDALVSLKKTLQLFVAVSLLLVLSACARHGSALIISQPQGAEVVDMSDDTVFGVTPVRVWWTEHAQRRRFANIRLQKEGYRDKTTSFWVNLDYPTREQALKNAQPVEVILDKRED